MVSSRSSRLLFAAIAPALTVASPTVYAGVSTFHVPAGRPALFVLAQINPTSDWWPWIFGGVAGALVVGLAFSVYLRLHRTIAESTRALNEVESRWLLAVRGINDGIWDSNLLTDEVYLSERCFGMLGFSPGEIQPTRSEWLSRVHPDDEPGRQLAMEQHLKGRSDHYDAEFRMRAKDGSYRWVHSRGKVHFDGQGRPVRAMGSHSDIHARKVAEEASRTSETRHRLFFEANPTP